ncbi:hypothetical protein [Rhodococcus sp. NPDC004095]
MGKPAIQHDPTLPTMSVDDAVAFCRDRGIDLVMRSTIKEAMKQRTLHRYLISNRIRLSETDIRSWIESRADANFVARRIPGGVA